MYRNRIIGINYVHTRDDRWVSFNRVYNVKYYELNSYEREELIMNLLNKYSRNADRLEFSLFDNKTIISLDINQ
jgi:hypothetical protein